MLLGKTGGSGKKLTREIYIIENPLSSESSNTKEHSADGLQPLASPKAFPHGRSDLCQIRVSRFAPRYAKHGHRKSSPCQTSHSNVRADTLTEPVLPRLICIYKTMLFFCSFKI